MHVLTHTELHKILLETQHGLREILGNKLEKLWLYGSYARGEATDESDIDVLALVSMSREGLRSYRRPVSDFTSDLDLKYDVLLSVKLQDSETFWKFAETQPFYTNVLKEGIAFHNCVAIKSCGSFKGKTVRFRHIIPQRGPEINDIILNSQKEIFRLRRAGAGGRDVCAYIVTLRKMWGVPLEQRVHSFWDCLRGALIEGETLDLSNQCFTVRGEDYAITYCLEAYKYQSQLRCFIDDGQVKLELLHRQGYEGALRWIRRNLPEETQTIIFEQMYTYEMMNAYPNPTDRFDHIVKETKASLKSKRPNRLSNQW